MSRMSREQILEEISGHIDGCLIKEVFLGTYTKPFIYIPLIDGYIDINPSGQLKISSLGEYKIFKVVAMYRGASSYDGGLYYDMFVTSDIKELSVFANEVILGIYHSITNKIGTLRDQIQYLENLKQGV